MFGFCCCRGWGRGFDPARRELREEVRHEKAEIRRDVHHEREEIRQRYRNEREEFPGRRFY
jgi:hypothetical protein